MDVSERLALAERALLLFGWSCSSCEDPERDDALAEAWQQWARAVEAGEPGFLSPGAHPELDEDAVRALAYERRARVQLTRAAIRAGW